jgi:hypothetical protein
MELLTYLPCSKQFAADPRPESFECSFHPHKLFPYGPFQYYFPTYAVESSGLFPSYFRFKLGVHIVTLPCTYNSYVVDPPFDVPQTANHESAAVLFPLDESKCMLSICIEVFMRFEVRSAVKIHVMACRVITHVIW